MKSEGLHHYLARLPPDLHEAIKRNASEGSLSMSRQLLTLLEDSLLQFPKISVIPAFQLTGAKSFCARLPVALHENLIRAASAADADRSLNTEILGRLIVMTSPSKQGVLNAWCALNELAASVIYLNQACPKAELEAIRGLRSALDRYERQLNVVTALVDV